MGRFSVKGWALGEKRNDKHQHPPLGAGVD